MKAKISSMTHSQMSGLFGAKPDEKTNAQLEVYKLEADFYCAGNVSAVKKISELVKKFNVKTTVEI